jgi:hypothetical protein
MILTAVGLTLCQGPLFMPTCMLYRVILVLRAWNDINKHIYRALPPELVRRLRKGNGCC